MFVDHAGFGALLLLPVRDRVTCINCKKTIQIIPPISKEMSEVGVSPDCVTYSTIIGGYCRCYDIDGALDVYNTMIDSDIMPNRVTCIIIVHVLCTGGLLEDAMNFFPKLLSKHKVADMIMSTIFIDWCFRNGNTFQALELWDKMQQIVLIQGLCMYGNVAKAVELLHIMLGCSMIPEVLIWNVVIDGFGKYGDLNNAYLTRDLMVELGVTPNVFTYNALIRAHAIVGNIVDALSLEEEMVSKGILPDLVTYNLLISGACTFGLVPIALQLQKAYADCRQSVAEASRLCVVATGMLCATPYEDICSPMARTIQFQNTRYMYLDFSTPQGTPACAKFRSWRTDEYCESVLPRATRCCPNVPSCFAQYQEVDD
ncbi:hypothetical protein QJS04_geneDACA023892 [Acorus gramineus]|uniref:Pentatricopeptide repeat-containing protein n=1 Tax=Acorus gramineus TaxID=55184 RepID=A0AAV9A1U3_ACOGR|nr:hypothetical protein QJS04_geneDACA023892 [Acorus gramineus]